MQRRWVLVAGALLVLLTILQLQEDPAGDAPAGDALDELLRASAGDEGPAGTRGGSPVLARAPSSRPAHPTNSPDGGAASGPALPAGPAGVIVTSFETAAALEKVTLEDETGAVLALTDEEGRAEIKQVPGTGLVIRVVGTGYMQTRLRVRPGDQAEIALRPGIRVLGRIVRAGTLGDPGAAEVSVWDEDLESEIASFTTDESGRFEIGAVRPNRPFLMTVRFPGLVPQVKRIVLDLPTKDLEVLIGEGCHLTGRVHTDSDVPLPGLEVRLLRRQEPILEQRRSPDGETRAMLARIAARVPSTRTDEDGRYAFHGIPLLEILQPVVLAGGRQVVRGTAITFQELGQTIERDILVPQSASLRILVSDESGQALGDADLEISAAGAVWHVLPSDERKDGAALLRDLTPGPFRLTVTRSGAPTLQEQGYLLPGEETLINVTVPNGQGLHGTVVDKRGAPIWKALVQWSSGEEQVEVRTEMDGRFRLRNLVKPVGTVQVRARDLPVSAFGYEDHTMPDVPAGGPPLKLTLKDGTRVRGSFPDLPPGGQVQSSMVPGTRYDDARLTLDDEFRFVRRGPLPQQAALFVFRTHGRPPILRAEETPFQSEEVRDLGPLYFASLNPRKGRVLDQQGLPLWAAKVTLETSWSRASVRTDRKGDFVFPHMPRRDLPILVQAEGYSTTPLLLAVGSEFKPQVIRLRKLVDITFQVVGAGSKQGRRARLSIKGITEGASVGPRSPLQKMTNRRGRHRVRLPPGRYEVRAKDMKTGSTITRVVDLSNEPIQTVQIEVPVS